MCAEEVVVVDYSPSVCGLAARVWGRDGDKVRPLG